MFGIGGFELFLILLFGFLIFGPDKLPAMAKTLGKAIAKFRNAQEEMSGVLKGEMVFDKDAEDPFKTRSTRSTRRRPRPRRVPTAPRRPRAPLPKR